MKSIALVLPLLVATAVVAESDCPAKEFPPSASLGTYSGNPHCHSGGNGEPFGFDFGYKIDNGCQPGTYTLSTGGSRAGSCPIAEQITVTIACNDDKSATISWSGEGDSVLAIKVKGSNGGTLYDDGNNGGNFIAGRNNGGQIADISHIEICANFLHIRKRVNVASLGGYPIYHVVVDNQKKKHIFDVVLNEYLNITVSSMKQLVNVKVNHADEYYFKEVTGLMGNLQGRMLARDGMTSLHDDPIEMGLEWQVHEDEAMLFQTARYPQFPQKCILPEITQEKEARRLGEGVTEQEAEIACAHLQQDARAFANCVYDVTATNDLELAQAGVF
ncbi:expressed unknown protein [Seminavis robusta]|uniref:VWFD domain-containing protein n=1 Tax=Seminavis robusta TaxID=568900 RepID=A0A9N8EH12_9STRA|nr:expressed unknown protein [Seminavis robusta]|eukprot:Sro1119_g243230.1 n/a (331) ;mRNA; r:24361-25638